MSYTKCPASAAGSMVLIVEPAVLRTRYFVYEPMVHVAQ